MRVLFVASFAAILLAIHVGYAQIPRTLTYQGLLTDTLGNPLPDASYSLTFRLYQTITGGSPLWQETRSLQTRRGVFSTNLGEVTPLSLPFTQQYWLSVQIGSDPELSPRMALTSSAYSLHTQKADTASYALTAPLQQYVDSARIAGTIPNNSVGTGKLQDSAVTSPKLADNAVSTSKIQNAAVTLGKIDPTGASNGQVITYNGSNISWQTPPPQAFADSARIAGTIPDNSVGTAKIRDAAVTLSKISSTGASNGQVIMYNGSSISWQTPPGGGLSLPYSGSVSAPNSTAFRVTNTASSDSGVVRGIALSNSGLSYGVVGESFSNTFNSAAVRGKHNGTGQVTGVEGLATMGTQGTGVVGAGSSTGGYFAVTGTGSGTGVIGLSPNGYGVWGKTQSPTSDAVVGTNTVSGNYGTLGSGAYGVYGVTYSTNFNAAGVRGEAAANSGQTIGVEGVSTTTPIGTGVVGRGSQTGGYFSTTSTNFGDAGVRGEAAASSGQTIGVEGISTNSPTGTGVVGRGRVTGGYFEATGPNGNAGVFAGKVVIGGDLQVSGKITGSTNWTNLPLAQGYVPDTSDSWGPPQYRKIGDIVYLRGMLRKEDYGDIPQFTVVATLPTGFRPPYFMKFATAYSAVGNWPAGIYLEVNGNVETSHNTPPFLNLDGVFFSTTP